jgi:3,5-epimerase/4-reductase
MVSLRPRSQTAPHVRPFAPTRSCTPQASFIESGFKTKVEYEASLKAGSAFAPPGAGCDFVLMGESGFIGSKMLEAVRSKFSVAVVPGIRLHQRTELRAFFEAQRPRHGVICCSGTRGNPNIDWCDTHPVETIDANITGQLNIATICKELDLHCALIGTGFVYAGRDGKVYTEEDPPDSELPKAYIKMRIALEQLLAYFPNVLNLRVIYPITRDISDKRGLIGKLSGFAKVRSRSRRVVRLCA